jgi:hypothetical protein
MLLTNKTIAAIMCVWWLIWLFLSQTVYNIFIIPSTEVILQFLVFLLSFVAGLFCAELLKSRSTSSLIGVNIPVGKSDFQTQYAEKILIRLNLICLLFLLWCLWVSGTTGMSFEEHFSRIRREGGGAQMLTLNKYTDAVTKVLIWPIAYTSIVISLSIRSRCFKWVVFASIVNIVLHCYLWQINYPLIHVFWIFVFFNLNNRFRSQAAGVGGVYYLLLFAIVLVQISSYRFGGDLVGGIKRYIYGYHLAGFSVYDYHYNFPQSVMHQHTYGRSMLGVIEQLLESVFRFVKIKHYSASSENADYLNELVEIGQEETFQANAFGTFLFGFYRDFNLLGIVLGGIIYGAVTFRCSSLGHKNWGAMATFYVLGSSWMMGMMVNPIEQPHFWLAIAGIYLMSIMIRVKTI